MPVMDGLELAELMRGSERTRYIPIIFITAGAHDQHRVFKGYESGAVDFSLQADRSADPEEQSRRVVLAHGGTIDVHSAATQTAFHVRMPRQSVETVKL